MANDVVLHQVLAQELSGVGITDAEHGAEFRDGHYIRIEAEALFIIILLFGCACGARCAPLQSGYISDGRDPAR